MHSPGCVSVSPACLPFPEAGPPSLRVVRGRICSQTACRPSWLQHKPGKVTHPLHASIFLPVYEDEGNISSKGGSYTCAHMCVCICVRTRLCTRLCTCLCVCQGSQAFLSAGPVGWGSPKYSLVLQGYNHSSTPSQLSNFRDKPDLSQTAIIPVYTLFVHSI